MRLNFLSVVPYLARLNFLSVEALHNERDKTMNPIVYAIPVFMLTILLEAWVARRRGVAVYDIPDAITSLHHGLLSNTNAPSIMIGEKLADLLRSNP
jgi:hypothetical protein